MKAKTLKRVIAVVAILALVVLTMTGCTSTGSTEESGSSTIQMVIMFAVLIAVFYFFLIRPENKKKKKLAEMRSALSVGDKITTIGGIVGKVVSISEDLITFETGEDRVRMEVTKWAISTQGTETEQQKK